MEFQLLETEASNDKTLTTIQEIQALCSSSLLFEQCLARLVDLSVHLVVTSFHADDKHILAIVIYDERDKNASELGHIFLDAAVLKKLYNVRIIPEPAKGTTADSRPEWYDTRDARLRIKYADYHEVAFAAPASLPELILSYALRDGGLVRIRKEIAEGDDCVPHFCIKLQLNCHFPRSKLLQQETFHIRRDRLQRLIDKRIAKMELELPNAVVN